MILGAVVIVVTGILVVNYFSARRGQTIPSIDVTNSGILPTTHTIKEGEDLWKISEKYYGTGYNWVDIASENNISDPNQIRTGDELSIPAVTPKLAQTESPTPIITREIVMELSPSPIPVDKELTVGKNVHKVVKGENLWSIAETYYNSGYNWVDIASANSLTNPSVIEEGQELTIPDVAVKIATTNRITETAISSENYTVLKGDSLWKIAVRAYGDGYKWVDIAKANNLLKPGIIHPGNILNLPR